MGTAKPTCISGDCWRSTSIGPRRAAAAARLQAAMERGELRSDADLPLLLDQLYGPLYYRFIVTREVTDVAHVHRHVTAVIATVVPAAPQGSPA